MSSLSSTLDSVTVYREGATCRRIAQIAAGPDRQLRLGGLPLSLEPGSLRARVQTGVGRVVDVRPQYDVELAEEVDVPTEQRAWEDAGAKLSKLELVRQRLNAEIEELRNLRPSFLEHKRGEPPRPAPVESMLALGEFSESELATRLEKRRALEQEIEDAKQEQLLRQRRMQEASSAKRAERARLSRVAVVTLAEAPAAAFELELEYRVPGARWVPSYALTLERGLTNGALQMRASVTQNTGEDWNDVRLSLSTANSSQRADMPELKALKIGRRQETPARSGWREPPPGLEALFEAYDSAMTGFPPPPRPAAPPAPPPQVQPQPVKAKKDASAEMARSRGGPPPGMGMPLGSVSAPAARHSPPVARLCSTNCNTAFPTICRWPLDFFHCNVAALPILRRPLRSTKPYAGSAPLGGSADRFTIRTERRWVSTGCYHNCAMMCWTPVVAAMLPLPSRQTGCRRSSPTPRSRRH